MAIERQEILSSRLYYQGHEYVQLLRSIHEVGCRQILDYGRIMKLSELGLVTQEDPYLEEITWRIEFAKQLGYMKLKQAMKDQMDLISNCILKILICFPDHGL